MKNSKHHKLKPSVRNLLLTLCIVSPQVIFAQANSLQRIDLSGVTLEGSLLATGCPEADAQIQISSKQGTGWLACQTNDKLCVDACQKSSQANVKSFAGKTLGITLDKSFKEPMNQGYMHFVKSVSVLGAPAASDVSPQKAQPPSATPQVPPSNAKVNLPPPKYSDGEIKGFIAKMNSIKPDMNVSQVLSIMGQPMKEQSISNSSPQKIFTYPLSIVVNFYRSSRTGEWQVATPKLYTNPVCQREDGAVQRNVIGAEFVETPGTNCIPQRFFPGPKSDIQGQGGAANWQFLKESGSIKEYFDPKSVKPSGQFKEVLTMDSYYEPMQSFAFGYAYQSSIAVKLVSCDQKRAGKNVFTKQSEYRKGPMGQGPITNKNIPTTENFNDDYWWKENEALTKAVCH